MILYIFHVISDYSEAEQKIVKVTPVMSVMYESMKIRQITERIIRRQWPL